MLLCIMNAQLSYLYLLHHFSSGQSCLLHMVWIPLPLGRIPVLGLGIPGLASLDLPAPSLMLTPSNTHVL